MQHRRQKNALKNFYLIPGGAEPQVRCGNKKYEQLFQGDKNVWLDQGLVFDDEIAALQRRHIRRNLGSRRDSRQSRGSEGLSREG